MGSPAEEPVENVMSEDGTRNSPAENRGLPATNGHSGPDRHAVSSGAAASRQAANRIGLYVHVPFCVSRCAYCAFNSEPLAGRDPAPYVDGLILDAKIARERLSRDTVFDTVFIGGGTPTILPGRELARLFTGVRKNLAIAPDAEITVEANPNRADRDTFALLRELGANRISIGVQSFDNAVLEKSGRSHSADDAAAAVEAARQAGFKNLGLDLIRGLPGESPESFRAGLETALSLAPEHISIYDLSIEPGSAFHRRREELALPDEEALCEMDRITARLTAEKGFIRYEISNYCQPGRECRHNLNYWRNRPYLGLGAGAVSYLEGIRLTNTTAADLYLEKLGRGEWPLASFEIMPPRARTRETVVMGLRTAAGARLTPEIREMYGDVLGRLADRELVEMEADRLRLTALGFRFANRVMAELV